MGKCARDARSTCALAAYRVSLVTAPKRAQPSFLPLLLQAKREAQTSICLDALRPPRSLVLTHTATQHMTGIDGGVGRLIKR